MGKTGDRALQKKYISEYDRFLAGLQSLQLTHQELIEQQKEKFIWEQLLLELVETQESAIALLSKWEPILQGRQQPQEQQQACHQPCAAVTSTGGNGSRPINNVIRMLQGASNADVLAAAAMSGEDWRQYTNDVFVQLLPLLEMVDRPGLTGTAITNPAIAVASASAAAAAAAGPDCKAAAAMPPGSAAAGASPESKAAAAAAALDSNPWLHQVDAWFDQYFMYGFISVLTSPLAMVDMCSRNIMTGQPQAAPPGHWRMLVQRLTPTHEQLYHMKLSFELNQRMEKLFEERATPLLQAAAEAGSELESWGTAGLEPPITSASAATAATAASAASAGKVGTALSSAAAAAAPRSGEAAATAAKAVSAVSEEPIEDAAADDSLDTNIGLLLQRALQHKQLGMFATADIVNNTFSKLQGVQAIAASYPYGPVAVAVASACGEIWEERRQRQQQEEEQQQQRQQQQQQPHRRGKRRQEQQQEQQEDQGVRQCRAAPAGGDDWPSMADLLRQDAERHMQLRKAELQARQQQWTSMFM